MKTTKTDSRLAYMVFAGWYLAGAAISTFLLGAFILKLKKEGMSPAETGALMAWAGLPWVIKPIWGGLVDRYRTKFWWAMVASAAVVPMILILPLLKGASFPVIVMAVMLPSFVRALQDVAVDSLAIDVIDVEKRGMVQTWMKVGSILGVMLGGAAATYLLDRVAWHLICELLVVISIITGLLIPYLVGKSAGVTEVKKGEAVKWKDFWQMLKQRSTLLGLLLAVLAIPAQAITSPVFYSWWTPYGNDTIALIFAGAPWLQIPGAILGGVLAKKCSRGGAVMTSIFLVAMAYCLVGVSEQWSREAVIGLSWLTGFADSVYGVVLFTIFMDLADKRFTAMSFALYMAGFNLCTVWGNWLGGVLDGARGSGPVGGIFVTAGLLQLLVLVLVLLLSSSVKKKA